MNGKDERGAQKRKKRERVERKRRSFYEASEEQRTVKLGLGNLFRVFFWLNWDSRDASKSEAASTCLPRER